MAPSPKAEAQSLFSGLEDDSPLTGCKTFRTASFPFLAILPPFEQLPCARPTACVHQGGEDVPLHRSTHGEELCRRAGFTGEQRGIPPHLTHRTQVMPFGLAANEMELGFR